MQIQFGRALGGEYTDEDIFKRAAGSNSVGFTCICERGSGAPRDPARSVAVETPQIFGAHLNKTFRSFFLMTRNKTTAFLIYSALTAIVASEASATGDGEGEWRTYSQELNGDVYFFDTSRVKRIKSLHRVWSRVRYKTSVMGASSYQSLLEIDCSERTEKILQNTFFSDKHWKNPAMNTDMTEKPKRQIPEGSATERLSGILCDQ